MLLWIIFAAMAAAATLAVIAPLTRGRSAPAEPAAAHDMAVYKDQLAEIDRDRDQGLIGAAEAEAARTEIARRLLKAAKGAGPSTATSSWARTTAVASVLFVPLLSLAVYNGLGSPEVPAQPLAARQAAPADPTNIEDMLARIEAHLVNNPADIEGWKVIAPAYGRLGRFGQAAEAYAQVIKLGGATPAVQEAYAEALVAANQGLVSAEAQQAADAAVAAEPDRIKARFYRALGLQQSGAGETALAEYDEIIRRSPADAPWLALVRENRGRALADLGRPADTPAPEPLQALGPGEGAAPGPGADDVAAAADMSPEEQRAMIDGMVERLATRLAEAPDDQEGWLRLIRAYAVLERRDEAAAAYAKARETFKDRPDALAALEGVARDVGIAN